MRLTADRDLSKYFGAADWVRISGNYLFLCNLIIIFEADSEDEGESSASEEDGEGSEEESEGEGSGDEKGEGMRMD